MARWFRCGLSVAGPFAPVARRCGWVPGSSTAAPRRESFAHHDGSGPAGPRLIGGRLGRSARRDRAGTRLPSSRGGSWPLGSLAVCSLTPPASCGYGTCHRWQSGRLGWQSGAVSISAPRRRARVATHVPMPPAPSMVQRVSIGSGPLRRPGYCRYQCSLSKAFADAGRVPLLRRGR